MSYKVLTIKCPKCKFNCDGVLELFNNEIKKLVGVNCYVCGFKKKIDNKIISCEKLKQKTLI